MMSSWPESASSSGSRFKAGQRVNQPVARGGADLNQADLLRVGVQAVGLGVHRHPGCRAEHGQEGRPASVPYQSPRQYIDPLEELPNVKCLRCLAHSAGFWVVSVTHELGRRLRGIRQQATSRRSPCSGASGSTPTPSYGSRRCFVADQLQGDFGVKPGDRVGCGSRTARSSSRRCSASCTPAPWRCPSTTSSSPTR